MKELNYTTVNAPVVQVEDGDHAGSIVLKFYRGLGWDGEGDVNVCLVSTSKETWESLLEILESIGPGAAEELYMYGPTYENDIEAGKVRLYDGWVEPYPESEG